MILHILFETLAYTLGFALYSRLRRSQGDAIPDSTRWTVIVAAAVGAVVGSKILYWLEDPRLTLTRWNDLQYLMGGKTIVGGLIGGLAGVEWSKWLIGERRSTGDLFALPLCLGIAVGRVGCVLAGPGDHTWGRETTSVLGIDGGDGIPRHCLPLYEIVFVAALSGGLVRLQQASWRRSGDLFRGFMIGYLAFRAVIETLKGDLTFAGLSAIQWAASATLLYYALTLRAQRARGHLQVV